MSVVGAILPMIRPIRSPVCPDPNLGHPSYRLDPRGSSMGAHRTLRPQSAPWPQTQCQEAAVPATQWAKRPSWGCFGAGRRRRR
eukprot:11800449-Alexandrium_andersonii.AAC.1